jgi:predicted PurR-regulated permease PerM
MMRSGGNSGRPMNLVAFVVILAALKYAQNLCIPVALAALLSLLLGPLVRALERIGIRVIPATLGIVLLAWMFMGSMGWILTRQVADLGRRLPEYKGAILARTAALGPLGGFVQDAYSTVQEMGAHISSSSSKAAHQNPHGSVPKVEVVNPLPTPVEIISGAFFATLNALGTAVMIFILVVFLLIYRTDVQDRLIHLSGVAQVNITTQTMAGAARGISRYLLRQCVVNGAFGTLVSLGLMALGIPNPLLWGILAGTLRFIPYVGTWLGAFMPLLLSLAVHPGWGRALVLLGGWMVLEIVVANVIEPWIYGSGTGITPLAVILSAFFWAWMWGGMGLLLAIPITASLVVLGRNIPQLSFFHTLLGRDVPLDPKVQLYQRLLAGRQEDAVDLLDQLRKQRTLVELYDGLFVPVLALAEEDRSRGLLEESRHLALLGQMKALIQDAGESYDQEETVESQEKGRTNEVAAATRPRNVSLCCLPASRPADELASKMLVDVLTRAGLTTFACSGSATAGEKAEFIERVHPDLVCVSAVTPSELLQIRYLYKRLRQKFPDLEILIGLWNSGDDPAVLARRIAGDDQEAKAVTTLAGAASALEQRLPALSLAKQSP